METKPYGLGFVMLPRFLGWSIFYVIEARQRINFSERNNGASQSIGEISEILQEGGVPPAQYLLLHPDANLSTIDMQSLINSLQLSIPDRRYYYSHVGAE